MSSAPVVAYTIAAAAYAGFQLTIRVVVYPQLARVPATASAAFERAHQRLVTPLVGVLFGALATTVVWCLIGGAPLVGGIGAALFALLLAATAFGAVPAHRVLDRGFDAGAHRRLLRWDTLRVTVALAQLALGATAVLLV